MVDLKKYTPSNKRFQKHTQHFVEGKTMKGHLNDDKEKNKNKAKYKGELIRVIKAKLYEDGWEVKREKKTYHCNYGDNILYLPPHKETELYYIPNGKCEVEFSVDKASKISTITRINDAKKQPIAMDNQGITLKGNGLAQFSVSGNNTEITGDTKIDGDAKVTGDIVVDTKKIEGLPDEISVTDLYKQVQVLQEKVSDKNGG